jgi:hypothetical protein
MSNLQGKRAPESDNNSDGGKVVIAAFTAFAGSAAGMAGILAAGDIRAAATIVALVIFGMLGAGALIVAGIYLRRR